MIGKIGTRQVSRCVYDPINVTTCVPGKYSMISGVSGPVRLYLEPGS